MKRIFPLLILCFGLYLTPSTAQVKYQFNIDKQPYYVEEGKLNDFFGMALNDLLASGIAKQRSSDLWIRTFEIYKAQAGRSIQNWDVYYDKVVNSTISNSKSGDINGLNADGTAAKGNPNKEGSWTERMAYINFLMSKYITNNFTNKRIR